MDRYHFWLAGFDTQPLGCPPTCTWVIHCRVDAAELRIDPEPGRSLGLLDQPAEPPCEPPQVAQAGRLALPLSSILSVALEPESARRGLSAPCALRLDLDRALRQAGEQLSRSLYLAALDPLDETLGASPAETAALHALLAALLAGRDPPPLDPNPYHRAFSRLGKPELAHRKQWNPADSPRQLAHHPLVHRAQAYERYRQFTRVLGPPTAFLVWLAWSLARHDQAAALFAVTLVLAAIGLAWLLLSWQAHGNDR